MTKYKRLQNQVWESGAYSIVPIRMDDRYLIMNWRNEQMFHLRQNKPLTKQDQDEYFKSVISGLFKQDEPSQLLFSYLENGTCIAYGGLVHINWSDRHAEISFLTKTDLLQDQFAFHWTTYLSMIEQLAFEELSLHKIYTYAYDLRPKLYPVLSACGYTQEAILKEHVLFEGNYIDVIIHRKLNPNG